VENVLSVKSCHFVLDINPPFYFPDTQMKDKLNNVDYRWYIVRTKPHQENMIVELLERYKAENSNILEIYAPTHTTVDMGFSKEARKGPLFSGFVFVLATQKALTDFIGQYSLEGVIQYKRRTKDGRKATVSVIRRTDEDAEGLQRELPRYGNPS